jgi:hypothetical protein
MTGKTFLNRVTNGQTDAIALLLSLLEQTGAKYCVIGGLAVNAYAEPVVSLDLDIVIVTIKVQALCEAASSKGVKIERFEHSINLSVPGSDLRIQIQTDARYQEFIPRAVPRDVLGYTWPWRPWRTCCAARSGPTPTGSDARANARRIWPTFSA